jgi:hypothetical protein
MMRKQQPVPYRLRLSRFYLFYLMIFHLFPRVLYHFIKRPYCRDVHTIDYELSQQSRKQKRGLRAIYDAMFSFLLDGYVELAGVKVASGSGQIMLFLVELAKCLDEYLDEYLEAGDSLAMDEALEVPVLREQRAMFRRYLELYGCAEPILKYVRRLFVTYYDPYVNVLKAVKNNLQFEDIFEAARIDSGIWLRFVMEVVVLFNKHQMDDEVLNDFFLFGMVGKFADDMADLVADIEQGSPNLLYALIRQNPEEYVLLQFAIKRGERLNLAWWKKRCPLTYMHYFEYIEYYYQQIKSSKVRIASMLMFVACARGIKHPSYLLNDWGNVA